MPDTQADQKMPAKSSKLSKYKWYVIGGLAAIAVLVFYFVNRSGSNALGSAGSTTTNTPANGTAIDVPGPPGPEGPAGPRGRRGKRGKNGKQHQHKATTGPPSRTTTVGKPVTHIASRTAQAKQPVSQHNARIQR